MMDLYLTRARDDADDLDEFLKMSEAPEYPSFTDSERAAIADAARALRRIAEEER